MTTQGTPALPPSVALMQMITGSLVGQAIHVAAKLGVADALKDGPKGREALAKDVGADPEALYRVLRALASFGIFAEDGEGRFALTPLAECLRSDVPGSMRAFATVFGEPWRWRTLGEIVHSVRTGQPAFDKLHGMNLFEYLTRNPEDARLFGEAMTSFSRREFTGASIGEIDAVLQAYDFSAFRRVVDVAGGHGSFIAAALKANPGLGGVLFDVPPVIEDARKYLVAEGLVERCEAVGGSFFDGVPAGGDVYVMKRVIHDWDDARAAAILTQCRRAMAPGGRVALVEMVIPAGNTPFFGKIVDLEMLLIGGRERTASEYRALLASAGFELTRIVPTQSPLSIVEGVPVQGA
nr:N-methyltransferase MarM [uncultured bacterium]